MLDHLVYVVPDLAQAIDSLGRLTGVAPQRGGRHARFGTHNALASLGDGRYLEVIAADPDAAEPEAPRPFGLGGLTVPRLNAWAFRTRDLADAVARGRRCGVDVGSSLEMGRTLPDSSTLRWRLTVPAGGIGTDLVPFFIDWGDSPHPGDTAPQGLRLVSLLAGHPDPRWFGALLAAFGEHYPVVRAAQPMLQATIAGPAGELLLT